MQRPSGRSVRRLLTMVAVAVALGLGLAGSASATPSLPGVPDCKDAPVAQLPGSGVTGFLDPGPATPPQPLDPFSTSPRTSVYEQFGYAGLGWHTYDLGCGGAMRDMEATLDTTTGNLLLSAATWGTAATNGLHNKVSHPEQYMAPLDDVVTAVTQRLHDSIWSPWGGAALLGVGALLLLYSASGRLSSVTSGAAWALLVLAALAGIAQYPTRVATFFDGAVTSSIASINSGVTGLSSLPPASDPARAQGALVVDRVLYDSWLRGQLGSTDSAAATRWGPTLFKASAFTWAEAQQAQRSPEAGRKLTERKAETWKKTAAQIQKTDPVAYGYLQGKSGGRAGTGLVTMLGATFTGLFRLVADIFLFAGLVMLRLLVMMFPAVAVIGVLAPMASIVRRVFAMGGASVVNVIAFSAGSAVHTTLISAILSRATSVGMGVLTLVLCLVVTAAAFVLLYPLLSFSSILGQSGSGHRLLRRGGREVVNYVSRREAAKDGTVAAAHDADALTAGSPGPSPAPGTPRADRPAHAPSESFGRPAPSAPVALAPDHRVDAAAYPSITSAPVARGRDQGAEPAHTGQPGRPGRPGRQGQPDPAYALAGTPGPTMRPGVEEPAPTPVVVDAEPLQGVLVDRLPAGVLHVQEPVHDSHTVIRPDGIGHRIYDPDTKQTVLSAPSQAPA